MATRFWFGLEQLLELTIDLELVNYLTAFVIN